MPELLVTVGVIGILVSLLSPALSGARSRTRTTLCLGHLKQLAVAWQLYIDDHNGQVPINHAYHVDALWRSTTNSWIGNSSAPYDVDFEPIKQGSFYRLGYIRDPKVYRCPADDSRVRTPDRQVLRMPRTRSYSMNGNFGGREQDEQTVLRMETLQRTADLFVFIDEDESSIDDGHFLVWSAPDTRWVNMPTDRHQRGGTLSFADGHVERWAWKWPKRYAKTVAYWKPADNGRDLQDLRRLQEVILPVSKP